MKILHLLCFPLYGSGSGTYARKLAESLIQGGHKVAIVCPDQRRLNGVKIYNVRLPFMAVFTGHPEHLNAKLYSKLTGAELNDVQTAFSQTIIRAVEKFQPDVIHVHHASNLAWIANTIKAMYQIHYVVTSHNTDIMNAIMDKRYIPLTQDALRRSDVITAVSDNTRDRLIKIFGKGYPDIAKKTRIVACGVDIETFPAIGSTERVNKKYNLTGKKVVLYTGKITLIKGVDIFVKAAKKLPEVQFIIVGGGGEIDKINALIKKERIKNVIITGYLGRKDRSLMSELYRRADVVSIPSTLSEGIPLTALEAMSSGTTVVASDIGGIPTAIKHLKNGVLVRPKNVASLVEGLKLVLEDNKLNQKLGQQARLDAVNKFSWKVISKQMEKLYQIPYTRSIRNRATKKPSYITQEEYNETQEQSNQNQLTTQLIDIIDDENTI